MINWNYDKAYRVGCERYTITTGYFMLTILTKIDLNNLSLLHTKALKRELFSMEKSVKPHEYEKVITNTRNVSIIWNKNDNY